MITLIYAVLFGIEVSFLTWGTARKIQRSFPAFSETEVIIVAIVNTLFAILLSIIMVRQFFL
jgi:hypothetical protein